MDVYAILVVFLSNKWTPITLLVFPTANFHIPRSADGIFDDIMFTEIYGFAAEKIVQQYKDDAMGVPFNRPQKRGRYQRGRNYGGGGGGGGPRQPYGY